MATNMGDSQGMAYGGYNSGTAMNSTGDMDQTQQSGQGAPLSMQQGMQQAQRSAGTMADKAREQIGTQLSSQMDRAGSTMAGVAEALRQAGQTLQDKGGAPVAGYVNSAADQVERASRYLSEKDIGELQADATRIAREKPMMVLAGAFALGFLGARFFKSSTPSQYSGSSDFNRPTYGQNRPSYSGSSYGGSSYGGSSYGGSSYAGAAIGSGSSQSSTASASAGMPSTGYPGGGDISGAGIDSSAGAATPRAVSDTGRGTYRE